MRPSTTALAPAARLLHPPVGAEVMELEHRRRMTPSNDSVAPRGQAAVTDQPGERLPKHARRVVSKPQRAYSPESP